MSKSKRILYMSTASFNHIVHEETCPHGNISVDHLVRILEYQIEQGQYRRCKCCSSLGFTLHKLEKSIAVWKENIIPDWTERKMPFNYHLNWETVN